MSYIIQKVLALIVDLINLIAVIFS